MMNDKAQSARLPDAKIRLKFNGKGRFTITQGYAKRVQDEGKDGLEGIPISQPRTAKKGNVTDRSHLVNPAILSSTSRQQQQQRNAIRRSAWTRGCSCQRKAWTLRAFRHGATSRSAAYPPRRSCTANALMPRP